MGPTPEEMMHQATQAEIELETERARRDVQAMREAQKAIDAAQERARQEALDRFDESSIKRAVRRLRNLVRL